MPDCPAFLMCSAAPSLCSTPIGLSVAKLPTSVEPAAFGGLDPVLN